jgi:hypothetical protein
MIDVDEALVVAEAQFPFGPEALVDRMGLTVRRTAMDGCDGWCVRLGERAIIRINSSTGESRQRFTLAHEIAHLLLGVEPELLLSDREPLAEDKAEEGKVNRLTGKLLLPLSKLRELVTAVPVDPATLKRVARRAHVSELMAACRIAKLPGSLELENAAVLGFRQNKLAWKCTTSLNVPDTLAVKLFQGASTARPAMFRYRQNDGKVLTASLVGSPEFPAVFTQLLDPAVAEAQSKGERTNELADYLFGDDRSFRGSVNGCISSFKNKYGGTMSLTDAVTSFYEHYSSYYRGEKQHRLSSAKGREYVKTRLSEWFHDKMRPDGSAV